ncbi:MAG TPA: phenylphosphate carboxylase subunit delta, partial [Rhodanobacteraceae bacterium]
LSVAVADAQPEVLRATHWCTRAQGGRGAAREVCDLILAARAPMQGQA